MASSIEGRLGGVLCDAVLPQCNWFEVVQMHEKGKKRLYLVPNS